jgi:hypothetical protein
MTKPFLFPTLLIALVFISPGLQCQQLTIQTDSGKQVVLNRADIEGLPHIKAAVAEHSGGPVTFEGVTVKSVLDKAGITFGESLKGKRLSSCLLVEAADGYRIVIALPELDPAFTDKQTLLVFLRDGHALGEKEGPYRIVIPDEKRMARWVRQVTKFRIAEVQ